jgi:hypothetical protein
VAHTRLSYRQRAGSFFFEAPTRGRPIGGWETGARSQHQRCAAGFPNLFKKRRATPTPMGTRAPVRGACVSAIAIGAQGAEGARKKLRATALAFPTAAAPLISPRLCGPPTGLTNTCKAHGPLRNICGEHGLGWGVIYISTEFLLSAIGPVNLSLFLSTYFVLCRLACGAWQTFQQPKAKADYRYSLCPSPYGACL